jgi:hypothetical protein
MAGWYGPLHQGALCAIWSQGKGRDSDRMAQGYGRSV